MAARLANIELPGQVFDSALANQYALRRGAVFGLSHNLAQLSLLRPARRHPGARGLHWVGASTRPGNGVPLVLIGAELAAAEALQDLGATEPGSPA